MPESSRKTMHNSQSRAGAGAAERAEPAVEFIQSGPGPIRGLAMAPGAAGVGGWRPGAPGILRLRMDPGHAALVVALDAAGAATCNGIPLAPNRVAVCGPSALVFMAHATPMECAWLSLPAHPARGLGARAGACVLAQPAPSAWAEFRQALRARLGPAGTGSRSRSPAPGAALAMKLASGGLRVMEAGGSRWHTVCQADAFLAAHQAEVIYLPDLCRALGVSARTLDYAFRQQLGMGPMRYLKLLRMQAVRQALRAAASVKEAALTHGFWDLGRFAADYKAVFGESPSQTPDGQPRRHNVVAISK